MEAWALEHRAQETDYYRGLCTKRKSLYIGLQGDLNPVGTDGSWSKVFRLWQQPVSLWERRCTGEFGQEMMPEIKIAAE